MCPKKKGTCSIPEKKELQDGISLEKIIYSASSDLSAHSEKAREFLVSLATDGSLEQHQTKGSIAKYANELLKKLREV